MIDPNFAGVDIHALGGDDMHNLEPVWHAVIDQTVAAQCYAMDITPDGSAARIVDLYSKIVDVGGTPTKASQPFAVLSTNNKEPFLLTIAVGQR